MDVCPRRGPLEIPDSASHILTVSSPEAVAIRNPSGDRATDEIHNECPGNGCFTELANSASHMCTRPSRSSPLTIRVPSGERATDEIASRLYRICPTRLPDSASQIRTVLSNEPLKMRDPSGENTTDIIRDVCPCRDCPIEQPVHAFHMRTVLSLEPLMMHNPLGETATVVTRDVCPRRILGGPELTLQIRTVWSTEPLMMHDASGETATDVTSDVCPCNGSISRPLVLVSQSRIVLSFDPLAK